VVNAANLLDFTTRPPCGKLIFGSPPLQEVRYQPSPHWPWTCGQWGFSFSWHRVCIS